MNYVPVLFRVKSHILSSACLSRPPRFVRLPPGAQWGSLTVLKLWCFRRCLPPVILWSTSGMSVYQSVLSVPQTAYEPSSPPEKNNPNSNPNPEANLHCTCEEARIIIISSIGNNNMCLKEKRWKTDAEILKYCFMIQKSDKLYFHYIVKSL